MAIFPPLPPAAKVWSLLPPSLHKSLLMGASGASRLLRLAHNHLPLLDGHPHRDVLVRLFADMFLCAWEDSFLDVQAAAALTQVQEQIHFLPPPAALFAARCGQAQPADPKDAKEAETLLASRDVSSIQRFLDARRKVEKDNLFWLPFAHRLGIHQGEHTWYEPWLNGFDLPAPIADALRADWLYAGQEWLAAAALYETSHAQMPLPGLLVRQGECLIRLGRIEEARGLWSRAFAERPWQSNLLLRLTDAMQGFNLPGEHPAGQGYILLYTWNHGPDLEETLAALASSNLGSARLLVLNNGSTDATASILANWSERLGETMNVVTLPVNIGAPAARNWLLAHESVKSADWAVFLDDDALVPPDWLGHLGTACRAHPKAGIIGCRVVEKAAPLTMQSIDLHFEAPDSARKQANHPGNNVLNGHINEADFGQYAYLRPCVSVTGCCHLFTRRSMDAIGAFDLRFSPSQFDDFERDLRSALSGEMPVYQGHLAVRHIKRNNMVAGMTPWQQANVAGNLVKLWRTYSPDQVEQIANNDTRALEKDLQARLRLLPV